MNSFVASTSCVAAVRTCGCVVIAMAAEDPNDANWSAKVERFCYKEREKGHRIEKVTSHWLRNESRWGCRHCRGKTNPPAALTEASHA